MRVMTTEIPCTADGILQLHGWLLYNATGKLGKFDMNLFPSTVFQSSDVLKQ